MAKRQNYNTKARQSILEYLKEQQENTVSASNIIEHLREKDSTINKATVYRYLNRLTEERKVLKFVEDESKKAVYQFINHEKDCGDHIHIKCINCGRLLHLDCDFMDDIRQHLFDRHQFTLKCDGSILYGICSECYKLQDKNEHFLSNKYVQFKINHHRCRKDSANDKIYL